VCTSVRAQRVLVILSVDYILSPRVRARESLASLALKNEELSNSDEQRRHAPASQPQIPCQDRFCKAYHDMDVGRVRT